MTAAASKKKRASQAPAWYLATNHLNLLYMLAAGLVMEPAGFGNKYYVDCLDAVPGQVPLFHKTVPATALAYAVSERAHLRSCILAFDLTGVSGTSLALTFAGKLRKKKLTACTRLGKNDACLLLPAPLPLTALAHVYFRSPADLRAFELAAGHVANVDTQAVPASVDETLFAGASAAPWPPAQQDGASRQGDLLAGQEAARRGAGTTRAQALGGAMAMLYFGAARSQLGIDCFRWATGTGSEAPAPPDPILAQLRHWLHGGDIAAIESIPARLYWGALHAIATEHEKSAIDTVLQYLEAQRAQLTDAAYQLRLARLLDDMRDCFGLGSATVTELLERNKGAFSRAMLLFCLCERCQELLEFSSPLLSNAEYLLACLLFGARDGWMRLPRTMRPPTLAAYVSWCMSAQGRSNELAFPQPPAPLPLRALFPQEVSRWEARHTKAALDLAQGCNWNDCLQTVVAPASGAPLAEPRKEGDAFVFAGSARVHPRVVHQAFLQRLGAWPPPGAALETAIRASLEAAA